MGYERERLGELLVKAKLIDGGQLALALDYQRQHGGKLGAILVSQLIVSEDQLARTLAGQKGLEYLSLANAAIDRDAVATIPERIARRRMMIPIGYEDGLIVVAMADPLDLEAIDDVELRSGLKSKVVVATESQIRYAIDKHMTSQDVFDEINEAEMVAETVEVDERVGTGGDVPVVRLVNQLIREAVADRASDIHIEPAEKDIRVRYRVDGVLHEVTRLPKRVQNEMLSRVKIMADMDIAERRRPQDGRILANFDGEAVDMRVATLPTPLGESIVIRVMNQGITFLDIEDVGMAPKQLEQFVELLERPFGAILVAGPTGSGKSTTLYAALKRVNAPSRKVITVEEPIEYQMADVTQMAVNNAIGLTFGAGLRQILRSDPDVVMVGEVRDPDTAETAVRAALTGHIVLSSIHTNDAPGALTRLSDMGVPPYVTSSALLGVVSQRLVRRLCPKCAQPVKQSAADLQALGWSPPGKAKPMVRLPVGCDDCFSTGYKGRIGVYEIMVMDDDIRHLFLAGAPSADIRALAELHGMRSLKQSALDRVADGTTSIEEVQRVVV